MMMLVVQVLWCFQLTVEVVQQLRCLEDFVPFELNLVNIFLDPVEG